MTISNFNRDFDANRQPLTAGHGSILVGTGAVVGGPAGEGVAEAIDATPRASWSEGFDGRDRVENGSRNDDHDPAYGFGASARDRYPGRDFEDVELEMSSDWATRRGASILNWEWAKHAARAAWDDMSRSSSLCA